MAESLGALVFMAFFGYIVYTVAVKRTKKKYGIRD